ncbi:hypothetical protein VTO73DRAFT_3066 [Trametes versicolor]
MLYLASWTIALTHMLGDTGVSNRGSAYEDIRTMRTGHGMQRDDGVNENRAISGDKLCRPSDVKGSESAVLSWPAALYHTPPLSLPTTTTQSAHTAV